MTDAANDVIIEDATDASVTKLAAPGGPPHLGACAVKPFGQLVNLVLDIVSNELLWLSHSDHSGVSCS